ncbi:MAG: hypothetical protein JWL77_5893 [Chthonomonadaceae bacterium]|nr:hypothetical protein [Chthonomonadaceae bacterium]
MGALRFRHLIYPVRLSPLAIPAGFRRSARQAGEAVNRGEQCGEIWREAVGREQVMSEVSQKQLVSKRRYVWLMVRRCLLACCSILCPFIALAFMFASLMLGFCVLVPPAGMEWRLAAAVLTLITALCMVAFGVLAIRLMKQEEKTVSVAPITRRNARHLPPQENLVRASDVRPTQQHAELLRASLYGKTTPSEELLRATVKDRQDL